MDDETSDDETSKEAVDEASRRFDELLASKPGLKDELFTSAAESLLAPVAREVSRLQWLARDGGVTWEDVSSALGLLEQAKAGKVRNIAVSLLVYQDADTAYVAMQDRLLPVGENTRRALPDLRALAEDGLIEVLRRERCATEVALARIETFPGVGRWLTMELVASRIYALMCGYGGSELRDEDMSALYRRFGDELMEDAMQKAQELVYQPDD